MKPFLHIIFAFPFLLVTVNMSGCSDGRLKTEHVSGIITLDRVPLADASVVFGPKVPGQGAVGSGRTDKTGEYIIQTPHGRPGAGTLSGEYTVTVQKYKPVPTGRMLTDPDTGEVTEETIGVLIFPEVYTNAATTPFSATVVKGRNRFDFDVKSQP